MTENAFQTVARLRAKLIEQDAPMREGVETPQEEPALALQDLSGDLDLHRAAQAALRHLEAGQAAIPGEDDYLWKRGAMAAVQEVMDNLLGAQDLVPTLVGLVQTKAHGAVAPF